MSARTLDISGAKRVALAYLVFFQVWPAGVAGRRVYFSSEMVTTAGRMCQRGPHSSASRLNAGSAVRARVVLWRPDRTRGEREALQSHPRPAGFAEVSAVSGYCRGGAGGIGLIRFRPIEMGISSSNSSRVQRPSLWMLLVTCLGEYRRDHPTASADHLARDRAAGL